MDKETLAKQMIKAAKNGNIAAIQALVAHDATLINAKDTDGSTPLHCAAWKGHLPVVQLLIEAGAEVNVHNQNDHWGTTPLHAAAHANHAPIVQLLIEKGADVSAKDSNGKTPLFHTTFHKANAAAKVLQQNGATAE